MRRQTGAGPELTSRLTPSPRVACCPASGLWASTDSAGSALATRATRPTARPFCSSSSWAWRSDRLPTSWGTLSTLSPMLTTTAMVRPRFRVTPGSRFCSSTAPKGAVLL